MCRIMKALLLCTLVIGLSAPSFSQAQFQSNDATRLWWFDHQGSPSHMAIMAIQFESEDAAWEALHDQIDDGWLNRYLDSPIEEDDHSLYLWCYKFTGDVPKGFEPLKGGVQFVCPVANYVYVVILYGGGYVDAAVQVVEDLILYDQPEVPEDWIDATSDYAP